MAYNFTAVFSGPCAYVPNKVPSTIGPASTWSVILPNLQTGWTNATQQVDRHQAVVQYDPAVWTASEKPDLELTINGPGGTHKSSVFRLRATQMSFVLPGAADFKPNLVSVPDAEKKDPDKIELLSQQQLNSLVWLAPLEKLVPGFGWFGRQFESYFDGNGLPAPAGRVAGHVLLRHGTLGTHELDRANPDGLGRRLARIWDFRDPSVFAPANLFVQAVALSLALTAENLGAPEVTLRQPQRTITLTPVASGGQVSLEIKNRELENIIGLPEEPDESKVDRDFRFLYNHDQQGQEDETRYPLPHLLPISGGIGGETATCGGSGSKGFAERFKSTIAQW